MRGDNVMLYHSVTLGATGWWKDMKRGRGSKRHSTVEDHVVISTGATILGSITIGARSKIGARALVVESLPADSIVLGHAGSIIRRCRSPHRRATADASRSHHTLISRC